jgi:tRNA A-37 threonylcarbamoyl transferase component Bud32
MQHSSTSTHRTFKPSATLKAKNSRGNTDSIDLTPSKTTNSNFANKFNIWKKKRASTTTTKTSTTTKASSRSDKETKKGDTNQENINPSVMYPSVDHRTGRRPDRTRPAPDERYSSRVPERSISSSGNRQDSRTVGYSETMYNQVVDGMKKMRSGSTSDDHTEVTSSSTQASSLASAKPSFSISDDGSTIVSELTTDASYAFHTFKVDKHKFTVDKRYSMLRTVGSGAYGVVISARDFVGGNSVAIKMVPKAFHDEIDAKRILREIKLLKHFHHENIISIQDMMPPLARNVEDFRDVYIVTDLMETDLHRIIYSKQGLSIDHVQDFMYQIIRAVKYIHSANVLHRDLKPSNLLVNSNCDLKVCDFGLARGISSTHDEDLEDDQRNSPLLTEYVVTRWYRAPEIMLACHEYSKPIDIWSVGCIFAELLGRKPFLAGDDYIDQVCCMICCFLYGCASR